MRYSRDPLKIGVIFIGILVYVAAVVYGELHNLSLMLKGVTGDAQILSVVGIVALGLTALALPIALHRWTIEPLHKMICYVFYGVDLLLIVLNTIVDFNAHVGTKVPDWVIQYSEWVLPATPLICAGGFALLFMTDPHNVVEAKKKQEEIQEELQFEADKAEFRKNDPEIRNVRLAGARQEAYQETVNKYGSTTPSTEYKVEVQQRKALPVKEVKQETTFFGNRLRPAQPVQSQSSQPPFSADGDQ